MSEQLLVAKFTLKDRCNNRLYLRVFTTSDSVVKYSLSGSNGIAHALANICGDIGVFPTFDSPDLIAEVEMAIKDASYVDVLAVDINPSLSTTGNDIPPVDMDKVRALLRYSFKDVKEYAGLTSAEKKILTADDFEALSKWVWSL